MILLGQYYLLCTLIAHFSAIFAYKYVRLQDYLCADESTLALQKPVKDDIFITFGEDHDSAIIISEVWNSTSDSKLKYDCQFRIVTKDGATKRGLYMVITKLKFRRDPKTNACYDYIQLTNGNREPSTKICIDISSDRNLVFDERDSEVSVHVFIDKRQPIVEPLELEMVMTSHAECKHPDDFLCDPKDPQSCISRYFVHDNITNCMYPCRDENSCFHDVMKIGNGSTFPPQLIDENRKVTNEIRTSQSVARLAETSPIFPTGRMSVGNMSVTDLKNLIENSTAVLLDDRLKNIPTKADIEQIGAELHASHQGNLSLQDQLNKIEFRCLYLETAGEWNSSKANDKTIVFHLPMQSGILNPIIRKRKSTTPDYRPIRSLREDDEIADKMLTRKQTKETIKRTPQYNLGKMVETELSDLPDELFHEAKWKIMDIIQEVQKKKIFWEKM